MPLQPVIAVMVDDADTRATLVGDLRQRYGADYTILQLGSAAVDGALQAVHRLAVVISTVEVTGGRTGVELLGGVRRAHPKGKPPSTSPDTPRRSRS